MYSAPLAGTDPVAPYGVSCIIGFLPSFVNSSGSRIPKEIDCIKLIPRKLIPASEEAGTFA